MGNAQSARSDDDESFFGGWMQAVGMAPTSNYAMWGSAGYPVMPTSPYPTGAQAETHAAQGHLSAANSIYGTPLAMPTAHAPHAQTALAQSTPASLHQESSTDAPSHGPIPLPIVQLRGPSPVQAGNDTPPQTTQPASTAGTHPRLLASSSRLSSIQDLRELRAMDSSQSGIPPLPGSHRSSLRQSSLDSNDQTPRANTNRSVRFEPNAELIVIAPDFIMRSPQLSTVVDSPLPLSSTSLTDSDASDPPSNDESDVTSSPTFQITQEPPSDHSENCADSPSLAMRAFAAERDSDRDVGAELLPDRLVVPHAQLRDLLRDAIISKKVSAIYDWILL
ncbi:hypothetical protein FOMPIDRAFT_1057365 [Fomitopsis schrenkii]|uniref:Uncharacterized protein n=1 Tax=Fomitopsis schrenkii TaxID=2126942 RepID=S8ERX1_FOMSC|nr:hypothetical protein FOMPIDRAFT_1057365 [Fomitopsis schrenkii]